MICFLKRKRRGHAHTRLVGGNYRLVGGNIRVVCPSTQETRRSQLTIVVTGQETRSFKCRRPPLFNWGCGARNPMFLGSGTMVSTSAHNIQTSSASSTTTSTPSIHRTASMTDTGTYSAPVVLQHPKLKSGGF